VPPPEATLRPLPSHQAEDADGLGRDSQSLYRMKRLKSAFYSKIADVTLHISGIDDFNGVAGAIRRRKRNFTEHAFHHRLKMARGPRACSQPSRRRLL
jgi:hypothetical protein